MNIKALIASIAIILATGLGTLATTSTAQAGEVYLNFQIGNGGRHYIPRDRYQRIYTLPRHRHCTPRKAVRKARSLGLRHPRVVRINRRVIKVVGSARGYRTVIKFARNHRCSVLRVR